MLIQIADPCQEFPTPYHPFKEIYQFEFADVENMGSMMGEFIIQDDQAAELVTLLDFAFKNDMNVVVHCNAGICRSGAVCEVGVIMGFEALKGYRQPNLAVKHKMMYELGLVYDKKSF